MNIFHIIIIVVLLGISGYLTFRSFSGKKKGGCSGCSTTYGSPPCQTCHVAQIIKDREVKGESDKKKS